MKKSLLFVAAVSITGLVAGAADSKHAEKALTSSPTQKGRRGSFDFDKAVQGLHSSFQHADNEHNNTTKGAFFDEVGKLHYTQKKFLIAVRQKIQNVVFTNLDHMTKNPSAISPDYP